VSCDGVFVPPDLLKAEEIRRSKGKKENDWNGRWMLAREFGPNERGETVGWSGEREVVVVGVDG